MATKNPIEQELLEATGIKKKVAEKFQNYANRLVEAVQDLGDEDWSALSTEAQKWVNAGAKAIKAEEDIDVFPVAEAEEADEGAEEQNERESKASPATKRTGGGKTTRKETVRRTTRGDGEVGDAEEQAEEEEDRPRRSTRRAAAEEDEEDRPARKGSKKPEKEKSTRKVGAQTMIKQLLIKKPNATTDELKTKLDAKGFNATPLAISSIRSGFRHSMRVLKDAGYLEDIEIADR